MAMPAGSATMEWKDDGRPHAPSGGSAAVGSSSNGVSLSHPTVYDSPVGLLQLPDQSVSHVNFHSLDDDDDETSVSARLSPKDHTLEHGSSSQESSQQNSRQTFANDAPSSASAPAPPSNAASKNNNNGSISISSIAPATVIAFINFHSGGKTGEMLAKDLVKALGEDKVFDLKGDKGPTKGSGKGATERAATAHEHL